MSLVEVVMVRELRHPPAQAYAWLTDFREDDGTIAGAIIQRRESVTRDGDLVRMATLVKVPLRAPRLRNQEVRLFPEELRWESRIVAGYGEGSVHHYRVSAAPGGCKLEVRYGFHAPNALRETMLRIARPLLRWQMARMWDGFERAMDRDLAPSPA